MFQWTPSQNETCAILIWGKPTQSGEMQKLRCCEQYYRKMTLTSSMWIDSISKQRRANIIDLDQCKVRGPYVLALLN